MQHASLKNRMLFAALAAVIVVAGGMSNARAADDEEDTTTIDQKILNGILGSIGLSKDRPNIEYRERSPLVVPPSRDLPAPETDAAAKNPAWPNDAGDKRRKDAVADRHRKNFNSAIDDGRVLRADELTTGSTSSRRGADGARRTEDVDQTMLKPNEMGPNIFSRNIFKGREET